MPGREMEVCRVFGGLLPNANAPCLCLVKVGICVSSCKGSSSFSGPSPAMGIVPATFKVKTLAAQSP